MSSTAPLVNNRGDLPAAAALVALALALRGVALGAQPLWFDEAYSFHLATRPDWLQYARFDFNPPLYYLLLRAWIWVAGSAEWALRLPSALAGAMFVGVAYWAGRATGGRIAALAAALFAALAPLHVYYSQEARAYIFAVTLLLALYGVLWIASERFLRRDFVVAAVLSAAALQFHYFTALGIVPAWALAAAKGRVHSGSRWSRAALRGCAAGLATAIPWSGWRLYMQATEGLYLPDHGWLYDLWEARPPFLHLVGSWETLVLGGQLGVSPVLVKQVAAAELPGVVRWMAGSAAMAACLAALLAPWLRPAGEPAGRPPGSAPLQRAATSLPMALVALVAAPVLPLWWASFLRPVYLVGRYDFLAFPALVLLVAHGIATLATAGRIGRGVAIIVAVALGAGMVSSLIPYFQAPPTGTQARELAAELDRVAADGDTVAFTGLRGVPALYELSRRGYDWADGRCRSRAGSRSFACRLFPREMEESFCYNARRLIETPGAMMDDARALVALTEAPAAGAAGGSRSAATKTLWLAFGGGNASASGFTPTRVDGELVAALRRLGYGFARKTDHPFIYGFARPATGGASQ